MKFYQAGIYISNKLPISIFSIQHRPVTHYLPNPLVQTGQITAVKLMQIWDKIVRWYSAQTASMITPVISTCHRGSLGPGLWKL